MWRILASVVRDARRVMRMDEGGVQSHRQYTAHNRSPDHPAQLEEGEQVHHVATQQDQDPSPNT